MTGSTAQQSVSDCGHQLGGGACQPQVHAARRRRHDHSVPSGLCSCAVRVCAADLRWVEADHPVARSKISTQCAGPSGSASNPSNHCATDCGPRPAQPSHMMQKCSLTSLIVPVAASTSTTSGRQCTVAAQSRHTAAQLRLRVGQLTGFDHCKCLVPWAFHPFHMMNAQHVPPGIPRLLQTAASTLCIQVLQSVVHHHLPSSVRCWKTAAHTSLGRHSAVAAVLLPAAGRNAFAVVWALLTWPLAPAWAAAWRAGGCSAANKTTPRLVYCCNSNAEAAPLRCSDSHERWPTVSTIAT
jgi:hypothetical protein